MIRSFAGNNTEVVWRRERSRKFADLQLYRTAQRKLAVLDAAEVLGDLKVPPNNRLEKLKGDRAGRYSIRVTQQWCICFRWTSAEPEDVELVDDR